MEFPIELKFFKKIELYQEYQSEEHKFRISGTRLQRWPAEKVILKWTYLNHHHYGSALTNKRIKEDILGNHYSHAHEHAIDALIQEKYAKAVENPEIGIKITKEGLLFGEVINEVENENFYVKYFYQLKYVGLFGLVWFTALSGAFIVIYNSLKLLKNIIEFLAK